MEVKIKLESQLAAVTEASGADKSHLVDQLSLQREKVLFFSIF